MARIIPFIVVSLIALPALAEVDWNNGDPTFTMRVEGRLAEQVIESLLRAEVPAKQDGSVVELRLSGECSVSRKRRKSRSRSKGAQTEDYRCDLNAQGSNLTLRGERAKLIHDALSIYVAGVSKFRIHTVSCRFTRLGDQTRQEAGCSFTKFEYAERPVEVGDVP